MISRVIALVFVLGAIATTSVEAQSKVDKKLRQTMTKSYEQLRSVEMGLMAFDKAMAGASSAVSADDKAHYQWLLEVRSRISARHAGLREAVRIGERARLGDTTNAALTQKIEEQNDQFDAMRNAVQQESRKFQTLSNASKARHEAAMNAIRNMKG